MGNFDLYGNLDLFERVRAVPAEAKKKISGGRLNGMTDINPMWRIKKLTEEFGPCGVGWYPKIIRTWFDEGADGETIANMEILLFVKYGDTWSEGFPGIGGSKFVSKEKNGYYTDDECYKKAFTDAISVACKLLGFGADVYWEKGSSKYDAKGGAQGDSPATEPQGELKRTKAITREEIKSYGVSNVSGMIEWLERKAGKHLELFTEEEKAKARATLEKKRQEREAERRAAEAIKPPWEEEEAPFSEEEE